jgi:predicted RNA-binding protein with PUA-like domain
LVKSEPETWSWDAHVKKGVDVWTGVRNHQAKAHLKAMKKGDLAFFYHSNEGKDIVGIAKVVKEHYPDTTAKEGEWYGVDFAPLKPMKKSVTLEQMKKEASLKNMELLRIARLSVSKVSAKEFEKILQMGETKV